MSRPLHCLPCQQGTGIPLPSPEHCRTSFAADGNREHAYAPRTGTVEDVVRDALDKVTDALTEGQTEAVVRRVTEGLSATVRPSVRPLDALANALHSVARHHGNDDESPLTSAEVTRLRQAAHVLFTLSEAGWQD